VDVHVGKEISEHIRDGIEDYLDSIHKEQEDELNGSVEDVPDEVVDVNH
jgi:hypothetical protein